MSDPRDTLNPQRKENRMTDCEFCGLPNGSLSLTASMLVCEDCVELAELMEDALAE